VCGRGSLGREEGGVDVGGGGSRAVREASRGTMHGGSCLHGCWGSLHAVGRARGAGGSTRVRRGAAGLLRPHHVGRHGATLHGRPMGGSWWRWAPLTAPHAGMRWSRRALHLRRALVLRWPVRGAVLRAALGAHGTVTVRGAVLRTVGAIRMSVWRAMRAIGMSMRGAMRPSMRGPVRSVWMPMRRAIMAMRGASMRPIVGAMWSVMRRPMWRPVRMTVRRAMGPRWSMRPRGTMRRPHWRAMRRPLRPSVVHAMRRHGATAGARPHVMGRASHVVRRASHVVGRASHVVRGPHSVGPRGSIWWPRSRAARPHVWRPLLGHPGLALRLKLSKRLFGRVCDHWSHSMDFSASKFV